jgi:hypothetical protein
MGSVYDIFGAVSSAPEGSYGVEVVPTDALVVTGDVDSNHDDSFPEQELLGLSSSGIAPPRQHNKLDLSFNVLVGPMEDVDDGFPSWHALMVATGHTWTQGGTAGTGNYIEYKPKSSAPGSATLYYYLKEDGAGALSILKHLGARGTFTFSIEGGSGPQLQMEMAALHGFMSPFSALTAPATTGLDLTPLAYTGKCWGVTLDDGDGPEVAKLISFNLARNNEIIANEDDLTACADGIGEIELEPAPITGTLVIEFEAKHVAATGDDNFWRQAHDDDTDYEVILTRDDGSRKFTITVPKARFGDIQQGPGDGRRVLTMPFIAQPTAGDDEYAIRDEVL